MSVRCRDIMALPALSAMRLVAGEQGLDRIVKWIYFADVIDDMTESPEWINGHELVVYSGTGYTGVAQNLTKVFYQLNEMNIAGFIINVGPYIPEIPCEAIAVANELKLPLFRLPWEIKLVNITHAICNALIASEMQEGRVTSMLESLLFGDMKTPEELGQILSANQLMSERGCVVGLCMITNPDVLERSPETVARAMRGKKALQNLLDDAFAWGGLRALTTTKGADVVFLTPNFTDIKSRLSGILMDVENSLSEKCPGLWIHTGLGVAGGSHPDLRKSYRQARLAAGVSNLNARITSYEDLGLLSLLLDIDDASLLRSYYGKTLGALCEYDRLNRTDLYHTLEAYYDNNSDLQNTAQELFIHKNTLKYRLNRICEILGCNIRETEAFLRVGVGIQVKKILEDKGSKEED